MTKVAVLKQDGSQAAELELNDAVFAIEPNNAVITDAVLMHQCVKVLMLSRTVQRFLVVDVSLGSKRVLVVHVPVQSVNHNSVVVESSSDQHLVHMPTVLTVSLTNWL